LLRRATRVGVGDCDDSLVTDGGRLLRLVRGQEYDGEVVERLLVRRRARLERTSSRSVTPAGTYRARGVFGAGEGLALGMNGVELACYQVIGRGWRFVSEKVHLVVMMAGWFA